MVPLHPKSIWPVSKAPSPASPPPKPKCPHRTLGASVLSEHDRPGRLLPPHRAEGLWGADGYKRAVPPAQAPPSETCAASPNNFPRCLSPT